MQAWPAALPTPAFAGEAELDDTAVRTDFEAGPQRVRAAHTRGGERVRLTLPQLSLSEFALFQAWYRHRLANGAASFLMPHVSGLGITVTEARFAAPYRYARRSNRSAQWFEVQFEVHVREVPTLTSAQLDALLS